MPLVYTFNSSDTTSINIQKVQGELDSWKDRHRFEMWPAVRYCRAEDISTYKNIYICAAPSLPQKLEWPVMRHLSCGVRFNPYNITISVFVSHNRFFLLHMSLFEWKFYPHHCFGWAILLIYSPFGIYLISPNFPFFLPEMYYIFLQLRSFPTAQIRLSSYLFYCLLSSPHIVFIHKIYLLYPNQPLQAPSLFSFGFALLLNYHLGGGGGGWSSQFLFLPASSQRCPSQRLGDHGGCDELHHPFPCAR